MKAKKCMMFAAMAIASMTVMAQNLVWVNGNNVNLRDIPSASGEKVGKAVKGMVFENVGVDGDWTRLKDLDGSTKYISSKFVTPISKEQMDEFTTDLFVIEKDGIVDYSVGKTVTSKDGKSEESETWRFMKEKGKSGIIAEKEWQWANTSGQMRGDSCTYAGENHGWYVMLTDMIDIDGKLQKLDTPIYVYGCLASDGVIINGELMECNSNMHTGDW